jgi:methylated-DNA-[protein]-cysteine S-methyltransferase
MIKQQIIKTPIGTIKITLLNEMVTNIKLHSNEAQTDNAQSIAKTQLLNYFKNPLQEFSFYYEFQGSDFQKKVCYALQDIPPGKTLTYGELAKKLNSHPRAVGQALKRNPLPILLPCHRVVSQTGIGGFSGAREGMKITSKLWLLNHETGS